jgi:phospholipase/lecithinase/hemolysin
MAALILPLAPLASANDDVKGSPFSSLVVFSGSLSDTGNSAAFSGDYPEPYYRNRTTNGPAAIDYLAKALQLSAEPSLHLIGKQGGTNFAVLHASAWGDAPIDLPAQLQAFLTSRNYTADPRALYFIFIGANDIVTATIEPDPNKSDEILQNGIASVETAFRKLHAAGARTFYAPNNVDLGITPVTRQYGVSARATERTLVFNRLWEDMLRKLERELDITIFRFDFFRQIDDVMKVTGTLGFTNVTDACLPLYPGGCELDRYAFLTDLLPGARVHEFFGNALAAALVQQLNASHCMEKHRCGQIPNLRPYADVGTPGESNQ